MTDDKNRTKKQGHTHPTQTDVLLLQVVSILLLQPRKDGGESSGVVPGVKGHHRGSSHQYGHLPPHLPHSLVVGEGGVIQVGLEVVVVMH